MTVEKESDILRAICDYLALKKHFFWRNNSYGIFDVKGGFHRALPKYSLKGVPDIILIDKTGHFVGLEAKKKGGVQSDDQKEFERLCKAQGAEYRVVCSVDDVINLGL